MKLIEFINKNSPVITEYMKNHFTLVLWAVVISLLIWVPVGIFITRNATWAKITMEIANIIFCIPSLALFSVIITIPFLGLGRKSALTALVLYSMMPLVRSVYQGIKGVDKTVIEAARGMGMNPRRILFEIQLPLAVPVVFAGFRVTVVMTTGIAAIATYIGERNLGRFIAHGLARSNMEMIIVGAMLISSIAVILDSILGVIEKKLISKGLRVGKVNR
ncbi:ABC transporter permease [Tepidibacter aestuarii]|uniref:ABC transporter permease n=1 Tax=Tepidibacter aestuarii TaxID=2925782 RepID=UPI002ED0E248|nr:osmoprotectant transport system permease protein [Tepidibacter aestuarii]